MAKQDDEGWFDVRAYSTKERWEGPELEDDGLDGFIQVEYAIVAAHSPFYDNHHQVTVVACGKHDDFEPGETVYCKKNETGNNFFDQGVTSKQRLAAAEMLAEANLQECARELVEMHESGILKDGRVRKIASICSFAGSTGTALSLAESIVTRKSLENIAGKSPENAQTPS